MPQHMAEASGLPVALALLDLRLRRRVFEAQPRAN